MRSSRYGVKRDLSVAGAIRSNLGSGVVSGFISLALLKLAGFLIFQLLHDENNSKKRQFSYARIHGQHTKQVSDDDILSAPEDTVQSHKL